MDPCVVSIIKDPCVVRTTSKSGSALLLVGQYRYKLIRVNQNQTIEWRCVTKTCTASVRTDMCNKLLCLRDFHTHDGYTVSDIDNDHFQVTCKKEAGDLDVQSQEYFMKQLGERQGANTLGLSQSASVRPTSQPLSNHIPINLTSLRPPPRSVPHLNTSHATPQVHLQWNSYHKYMQAGLTSLLTSQQFADVTVACGGKSIKCHKVFLSVCSDYFAHVLSQNDCQHPIIFIKDIEFFEMQALLEFMYCGQVTVAKEKIPGLLQAAEALQIKGLIHSTTTASGCSIEDEDTQPQSAQRYSLSSTTASGSVTKLQKENENQVGLMSTPTCASASFNVNSAESFTKAPKKIKRYWPMDVAEKENENQVGLMSTPTCASASFNVNSAESFTTAPKKIKRYWPMDVAEKENEKQLLMLDQPCTSTSVNVNSAGPPTRPTLPKNRKLNRPINTKSNDIPVLYTISEISENLLNAAEVEFSHSIKPQPNPSESNNSEITGGVKASQYCSFYLEQNTESPQKEMNDTQ